MKKWTTKQIIELRKRTGLSRELFARKLGVSMMSIYRWERSTCQPVYLARIALERLDRLERTEI